MINIDNGFITSDAKSYNYSYSLVDIVSLGSLVKIEHEYNPNNYQVYEVDRKVFIDKNSITGLPMESLKIGTYQKNKLKIEVKLNNLPDGDIKSEDTVIGHRINNKIYDINNVFVANVLFLTVYYDNVKIYEGDASFYRLAVWKEINDERYSFYTSDDIFGIFTMPGVTVDNISDIKYAFVFEFNSNIFYNPIFTAWDYQKLYHTTGDYSTPLATFTEKIKNNVSKNNYNNNPEKINGSFDNSSDIVTLDEIDSIQSSAYSSFVNVYKLNANQISELKDFLYSDGFIDNIKKLTNNPMDNIINFILYPFDIQGAETVIKIGNVTSSLTAVNVNNRFHEIDFGSVYFDMYYGNYLDDVTTLSIYLPFIGVKTLNINDCRNSNLNLKYRVDMATGSFVAIISVSRNENGTVLSAPLYNFEGNIGLTVPLTSTTKDYLSMLGGFGQAVQGVAGGNPLQAVSGIASIVSTPTVYDRSGSLNDNTGYFASLVPFLIIDRVITNYSDDYKSNIGFTSTSSAQISKCKGFLSIQKIVNKENCNNKFICEIESILQTGVYIK